MEIPAPLTLSAPTVLVSVSRLVRQDWFAIPQDLFANAR